MNNKSSTKSPTFIDLFSGVGGFSLGFVLEGFQDLCAVEKDNYNVISYKSNFPQTKIIEKDIREIHSLEILKEIKTFPDVIIASPPCEPFTTANPNRLKIPWKRFYEYRDGDLVFHAIRLIGDLEPKFFVIENVIPMVEGEGKDILKNEFQEVGFNKIYFNFLSAELHGCPSVRKRVFITNFHLKLPERRTKTVKDVLESLPSPTQPNDVLNHQYLHFTRQVERKAYSTRKGQAAVIFQGAKNEQRNWIKLDENKICPTIMGKSRFIHPTEDRSLTVREHARLMSFPDNFVFEGTVESMLNQIGEAVPPIISKQIANKIKEKMNYTL